MTRHSIKEYAQAIHKRYKKGSRELKARILDEFVAATQLHRKSAIRLLARPEGVKGKRRRGRRKVYSVDTVEALKVIWRASGGLCSKRLRPFIPEMTRVLRAKDELFIRDGIVTELDQLNPIRGEVVTKTSREARTWAW